MRRGIGIHTWKSSTQETEVGGLKVWCQPWYPQLLNSLTNSTKVHVLPECLKFVLWTKPCSPFTLPAHVSTCTWSMQSIRAWICCHSNCCWVVGFFRYLHPFRSTSESKVAETLVSVSFLFSMRCQEGGMSKAVHSFTYRLVRPCVQCLAILPEVSGLRHLRPRNFRLGMLNLCYLFAFWYVSTLAWYMGHLQISARTYVMGTFY